MHYNQSARTRIGKRSGAIGLVCNILLALSKILLGRSSGSTAIFADGINNLSDGASAAITLLAFHLAEKPADKHHPYGHARFEYLASLTVSMLILVFGFELGRTSIEKILHPTTLFFTPAALWILLGSAAVKLILMVYNRHTGKKIRSKVLLAAAADSRNDALTTLAVLFAVLIQQKTGLQIDGFISAMVSVFILLSALSMARDTISSLLGEGADPELQHQLTQYIRSQPQVMGCHDLMVHDYGPGRCYASIHVEMDHEIAPMMCHEVIDSMERGCLERFGVHLVIHFDPVGNDPETQRMKVLVSTILHIRDPRLEFHDFRLLPRADSTCLMFDLPLPEDLQDQKEALLEMLSTAIHALDPGKYTFQITFDL